MFEGIDAGKCKCDVKVAAPARLTMVEKTQAIRASIDEANRNINAIFHCLYGEGADEPNSMAAGCLDDELTVMKGESVLLVDKTRALLERICGA